MLIGINIFYLYPSLFIYLLIFSNLQTICVGVRQGTMIPNFVEGCNSYYLCAENVATLITCGPGLKFNPLKNYCDWSREVICVDPAK